MKNDELDALKSIWKAGSGEQAQLNREELLPLIRQRAQTAFSSMRRSLLLESVLGVLTTLVFGYIVSQVAPGNGEVYLAALQMVFLGILPLGFFYGAGFRHLSRGVASDARLVPALQQTIAYWDQSLRLYYWGGAVLMPAFMLSLAWFVNSLGGQYFFKITDHMPWQRITAWILGLSVFSMVFVWISLKTTYVKHVERLKTCLRELEEGEC